MNDSFPVIPGYQILKQMGQGGMAAVYLAIQQSFGRQVALKVMSDQLGKDDVWAQRFMHEARIVAQLSHSNIVPVFDVGSHAGRFYISMELLKGGKLDEKMQQGLAAADAVNIVKGVAAGLDYAGSKGFVHRDIKPDNIMFRDDGTPVILDFGIAKQKDGDSKMTKTGTIVGTTGYMSPEQAMGQELDERSDIYSLGIMFYELLTGAVPFRGDSAVAVLLKHVQEAPPPLPPALSLYQPALDKALAKKPDERYRRAGEMIDHLRQIQQGGSSITPVPLGSSAVTQAQPLITQTGTNDATVVTTPVQATAAVTAAPSGQPTKKIFIAMAGVIVLVLGMAAWLQTGKPPAESVTPATLTTENVPPAAAASEPATESNNQRAVARIVLGAAACLKKQQYDCAKSKAESALDLDPHNPAAKKILAQAEKAQQAAFSGDWDAH